MDNVLHLKMGKHKTVLSKDIYTEIDYLDRFAFEKSMIFQTNYIVLGRAYLYFYEIKDSANIEVKCFHILPRHCLVFIDS